ncbi:MAG: alpha/beta fold hydrolase [Candidatus Lambdaproteobacteria bacterium]|nr:alpha/beta fold hydrolase [Candidatus Lambdaproteobacteria bacterium]
MNFSPEAAPPGEPALAPGWVAAPQPIVWLEDGRGGRLACTPYDAERPWLHLLVSHGFAEHRGWWDHVARALRGEGVSVLTFDHFHHGQSTGRPGDPPGYDAFVRGFRLALEQGLLPRRRSGGPLAVLGHSNGGLIALRALRALPPGPAREWVQALVLSAPLLGLPRVTSVFGRLVAWLMERVDPALRFPLHPLPWRVTGNRAIWGDYLRDPLRGRGITARYFWAMLAAAAAERAEPGCRGLPLLLLTDGREHIVSQQAMEEWFRRVPSSDKERRHYPGLHHEMFNEVAWRDVLGDVLGWLRRRFDPRSTPGRP